MSHDSEASRSLRSPLANARGRGTSHSGSAIWWTERLTALALVPLTLWFLGSLLCGMVTLDADGIAEWLSHPIPAMLMVVFILVNFLHAKMGAQVVIEDYVHSEGMKIASLLAIRVLFYGAGLASLFAVFKLHFLS